MNRPAYRAAETPTSSLPAFSTGLKWIQLVLCIGAMGALLFFVIVFAGGLMNNTGARPTLFAEDTLRQFGFVWGVVAFCTYGAMTTMAVWVGNVWSWVPEEERRAKGWTGPISPLMASGLSFIPTFQFVWAALLLFGLQNALTHMREVFGRPRATERMRTLGILALVFGFSGMFPIAGLLAFLTMAEIEKQIEEVRQASASYLTSGMPLAALPPGYRALVAATDEDVAQKAAERRRFKRGIAGIAAAAMFLTVVAPLASFSAMAGHIVEATKAASQPKRTAPGSTPMSGSVGQTEPTKP